MARLRKGRANTARGAANFLLETVSRVRYAGATGPLTMRADSGFYNHPIVAACRHHGVRYSITVRQHPSLRNLIEAIPEEEWAPIPYWIDGGADVAETIYTPFSSEPDAVPVRLIVPRVKPTPGTQLALLAAYSFHAFITDREGDTLALEANHRRLAGHSSHGPQSRPLDDAYRPGRTGVHRQDPPTTLLLPGRTHHPQGPPPHPASSPGQALAKPIQQRPGKTTRPALPS